MSTETYWKLLFPNAFLMTVIMYCKLSENFYSTVQLQCYFFLLHKKKDHTISLKQTRIILSFM